MQPTFALYRRKLAMPLYAAITATAYLTAFLFRFDFRIPAEYFELFAWSVWPLVLLRLAAFRMLRLTRERWRYASAGDVIRLGAGTAIGSAVFLLLFRFILPLDPPVPVSVVLTEGVLMCWLTAALWLGYRTTVEWSQAQRLPGDRRRRALIVGAGDAGNLLAREMRRQPFGYQPVGFIDDAAWMWRSTIQGVEVLGGTDQIPAIAARRRVDEVIIAIPTAGPDTIRRIVAAAERVDLPVKVLPGIEQVLAGEVSINQLREVQIEDLLGREPIVLELPELAADLTGRSVLITGAAGSIGSELARQVALHKPAKLVLLDQAETELFYLERELEKRHPQVEIVPLVGDIVDASGMRTVFDAHRPDRVFHAAAYKHVSMMEANVREAVRNNVVGTWRVAQLAGEFNAAKFVLVSTDKAVRPSNAMGATKRLAELLTMELQEKYPATSFGAVRFGNVLGSAGSVIPIFRRQLESGEALTVTDPEATRYFMTIPEAVQLILQASLLPELRGHTAMLEMGDPVRIRDLAENLLHLSGVRNPERRIVYTGLRPGEKLHEELASPEDESVPTPFSKVRMLRSNGRETSGVILRAGAWERALQEGRDVEVHAELADIFRGIRGPVLPEKVIPLRRIERAAVAQ